MKRVGILTGGGDCPGLNPAIRGVARTAATCGWQLVGLRDGWRGALEGIERPISPTDIDDLLVRGGTILGSSRTNPYKEKDGTTRIRAGMEKLNLKALIAAGGEDTLGVAAKLFKEGLPVVGIPKTIDNDLDGTDLTLGFATAVQIVSDTLDRIRTTAESHSRIMVVEVMGRHAGWLAAYGGIAGGADLTLVPEYPVNVKEVLAAVESCRKRGKYYSMIVVAEGAKLLGHDGKEISEASEHAVDDFGHVRLGGIGERITEILKKEGGYDARNTILGHAQRGGTPNAFDRILSTSFGVQAMKLVEAGDFGKMPALRDGKITVIPLEAAVANLKTLTAELYDFAKVFFG